jgi:hypothetical protein
MSNLTKFINQKKKKLKKKEMVEKINIPAETKSLQII